MRAKTVYFFIRDYQHLEKSNYDLYRSRKYELDFIPKLNSKIGFGENFTTFLFIKEIRFNIEHGCIDILLAGIKKSEDSEKFQEILAVMEMENLSHKKRNMENIMNKKLGIVGQGYVGHPLADWQEEQGFDVIRYGLQNEYIDNKEKIGECDIVFVCVPTPTVFKAGQNLSAVIDVIKLCKEGAIVVIKSTVLPGTVKKLEKIRKDLIYVVCPEFLDAATNVEDTRTPRKVVIGIKENTEKKIVRLLKEVMPANKYHTHIMSCDEACMVKYVHNGFFYMKNVWFNMMADMSKNLGCEWRNVVESVVVDDRVGSVHTKIEDKGGRGAGGNCLIKDMEVMKKMYIEKLGYDSSGVKLFFYMVEKNQEFLRESGKDLDILEEVYGK